MTNKEIFLKAMEKAEKNGWKYPFTLIKKEELIINDERTFMAVYKILFTHDFPKAFWSGLYKGLEVASIHHPDICVITEIIDDKSVRTSWKNENPNGQLICDLAYNPESWKKRLQEMVLAEDPFKYLEKFL